MLNLKTAEDNEFYIDCVLLHSPLPTDADTLAAWNALEEFVPDRIRHLGISNTSLSILKTLYDSARVKPAVVQNRFHSRTRFDRDVRKFCVEKTMVYQAFWTLTANPALLQSAPVLTIATEMGVQKEAALYCLILGLDGVVVMNGTTNVQRMRADNEAIKNWCTWSAEVENKLIWKNALADFKILIGDH